MKTRAVLFSVIATAIFLIMPHYNEACAGENEDFRFAEKLNRDKMFIAAAEEYTRFCEKYPTSTLRPKALFSAGECWMQAGKPLKALESFGSYISLFPEDKNICKAKYYRGHVFKTIKRYKEGANEFILLADENQDCPLVVKALLDAGECLMSAGDETEAIKTLKRLVTEHKNSDLIPRALYTISLSLINMDRELEAYDTLEKLARNYPDSPLAAFALLKLGERAADINEMEKAEGYLKKILASYKEDTIKERALYNLINLYSQTNDYESALSGAERYIADFKKTNRKDNIYITAIDAASRIDDTGKALSLIDDYRKEFAGNDSTGWTYVKSADLLQREGRVDLALKQLESMRSLFPKAYYSTETLLLKADLNYAAGLKREAVRYYNMALAGDDFLNQPGEGSGNQPVVGSGNQPFVGSGNQPGEELESRTGKILIKLAGIYSNDLSDTISAVRCLKEAAGVTTGISKQEVLYSAARLSELIGDYNFAAGQYSELIKEFPDGDFRRKAGKQLEILRLRKRWDRNVAEKLKLIASSGTDKSLRLLEAGIIFNDDARDPDTAVKLIERAVSEGLPEEMVGKAKYYLGKAYSNKYKISVLKEKDSGNQPGEGSGNQPGVDSGNLTGEGKEEFSNKASSFWLDAARNYNSTKWGEEAHKAYLNCKFPEWTLDTRLKRLDEFLKYYKGSKNKWWAVKKKTDFLFEAALSGEKWAVDSTMAVFGGILSDSPPDSLRYDTIMKKGYLYRNMGNNKRAAELLSEYLSNDSPGTARASVCYDLGEIRVGLKEYQKAMADFDCCFNINPRGGLAESSYLRKGDCYYFMKRYDDAEKKYGDFLNMFPESSFSDIAEYRRGLALNKMKRTEKADSIFQVLLDDKSIDKDLRVKLLEKMGGRYNAETRYDKAKEVYTELASLEETAVNLTLLAEVLKTNGDMKEADQLFSRALKLAEADTCRVLKGRAEARFRLGKYSGGEEDLERLWDLCPDSDAVASVLLEKGMIFINNKEYGKARETLDYITANFKDTEYAKKSLYYQALCDIESGGYKEAENKLNLFLAGSPHSPIACMAYFKLASVELKMEKLNLAARNYSLASEACSDPELSFNSLKNLAQVYQKMEDWEKASLTWEEIVEKYPADSDIVETLFKLGFAYSQSGRFRLAYDVYSRIPAIVVNEKQLGRAHYWAGISLKNIQKYREAVREFLRVPYLRTGGMWGVTSKLEAAGCYSKLKMYDEAAKIYEGVILSHGKDSDWGKIAAGSLEQMRKESDGQQKKENEQEETE